MRRRLDSGLFQFVRPQQDECVVLHRGDGFRRLPAEKFLHLVSVVAAERRQLSAEARQQVKTQPAQGFIVKQDGGV